MNSIEALENIAITFDEGGYEPTTLGAKSGHFKEVFGVEFNIIEQDLKRLRQKQLEEKNKELKEKINKLNKELVIEREVGGMTSKEALEQIMRKYMFYVPARNEGKEHLLNCLNIIAKDLERLKQLEEENQDLKNRLDNEQLAFDKLFESNQKLSELYAKLKQALDILKDKLVLDIETEIAKENDIELIGYWLVEGVIQKFYTIITKEEYELLKEILEDES